MVRLLLSISFVLGFLLNAGALYGQEIINWRDLTNGLMIDKVRFYHTHFESAILNGDTLRGDDNLFSAKKLRGGFSPFHSWEIRLVETNDSNYLNSQFKENTLSLIFSGDDFFRGHLSWAFEPVSKFDFIIKSECDTISKLIYKELVESFQRESNPTVLSKETDQQIDVNELFDKMKSGTLKPWLISLPDSIDRGNIECVELYDILRFIKDGEHAGFATAEYRLPTSITSYITYLYKSIERFLRDYKNLVEIDVQCIGYADTQVVTEIPFALPENNAVYYDTKACREDKAYDHTFIPVQFSRKIGLRKITNPITNNCQLSGVRAYNAISYFESQIGDQQKAVFNLTYAAGGTLTGEMDKNRKIRFKITFKGIRQTPNKK